MECKVFIRRNFGHGYKDAWPRLSFFQRHIYWPLVRKVEDGMSRRFWFWIYRDSFPDKDCADPGAVSRHPVIEMTIVFPWGIKDNPVKLEGWNAFIGKSRGVAFGIRNPGIHEALTIEIPETWKGGSEW